MCDAEPAAVAQMLEKLYAQRLIHGASLAGAGGGGFLVLVTRRPHARAELEAALSGTGAVFYDVAVDGDGLELSVGEA